MKKNITIKSRKKGFTIVETLVAISILTIALTGPLAIIAQALRSSFFARDQVVAYYLAQEAIEYIRNKRDNNSLATNRDHTAWMNGIIEVENQKVLNAPGQETHKLNLVRSSGEYQLRRCNVTCPNLKYADPSNPANSNFVPYGEDSPGLTNSKFVREIILNSGLSENTMPDDVSLAENREVLVTVRVRWSTPSGEKSVLIRESLFNWQIENFGN